MVFLFTRRAKSLLSWSRSPLRGLTEREMNGPCFCPCLGAAFLMSEVCRVAKSLSWVVLEEEEEEEEEEEHIHTHTRHTHTHTHTHTHQMCSGIT